MSDTDTTTGLRLMLRVLRHAASVTAVRRLVDRALADIGVLDACREDIVLALGEACNNAVYHAATVREYAVVVMVDARSCVMEVVDNGPGMADVPAGGPPADPMAEHGRGLLVIRGLTDDVEVRHVEPHGVAVRMTKTLAWAPGTPTPWTAGRFEPWTVHHR